MTVDFTKVHDGPLNEAIEAVSDGSFHLGSIIDMVESTYHSFYIGSVPQTVLDSLDTEYDFSNGIDGNTLRIISYEVKQAQVVGLSYMFYSKPQLELDWGHAGRAVLVSECLQGLDQFSDSQLKDNEKYNDIMKAIRPYLKAEVSK